MRPYLLVCITFAWLASSCTPIIVEGSDTAAEVDAGGSDTKDTGGCTAYCVGQQAYACNTDGLIVAAQLCDSGSTCTAGACIPNGDKDTDDGGGDTTSDAPDQGPGDTVGDGDATGDDGETSTDGDVGDGGCIPTCSGKDCGDDGCGGVCGECVDGAVCDANDQCGCIADSQQVCSGGDSYYADSCGNIGNLVTGCGGNGCTDGFCDNCIPQCAGLECGDDSCGGTCGDCVGGAVCATGLCVCQPQSEQKCVVDALYWHDSCGFQQGFVETCEFGCANGACEPCTPTCGAAVCGDDGCGGVCGSCQVGESCVAGACACAAEATSDCVGGDVYWFDSCGTLGEVKTTCPGFGCSNGSCDGCTGDCTGKECGDDGCGTECGPCTGTGEVCQANQCNCLSMVYIACSSGNLWHFDSCNNPESLSSDCQYGCTGNSCDACQPACEGRNCGDDGCGGSCGTCTGQDTCNNGIGQCVCQPACTGAECGNDGCGGDCGNCTGQDTCNGGGQCVCQPDCSGKNCGADGCGGSCGTCTGQDACNAGQCVCQPDCAGKDCGSNGCGGVCGTCSGGSNCTAGQCVAPPTGHLIFTTSGEWLPGTFGGGLALQDLYCQQLGSTGQKTAGTARTWIALMSDSTIEVAGSGEISAKDRPRWSGALANTQGQLLTDSPQEWPFDADKPPVYDENGAEKPALIPTGTKAEGTSNSLQCHKDGRAWNGTSADASAGDNTESSSKFIENGAQWDCKSPAPIYCVNVADKPDHIIFATSWSGAVTEIGGLTQADAICQNAGQNFDSTRSWVALMSDSLRSIAAKDRVGWHGPVYNIKGDLIEANPKNWPWTPLNKPVRYDETGKDLGSARTHTGTNNSGTPTGNDCQNDAKTQTWVNASAAVTAGRVSSTSGSNGWMHGGGSDSCGNKFHIYCVSR